MMNQRTYTGVPGEWIILSLDLEYKNVVIVHRDGTQYDTITFPLYVSQGNRCIGRQAWHNIITGVIVFDYTIPFADERINVVYET